MLLRVLSLLFLTASIFSVPSEVKIEEKERELRDIRQKLQECRKEKVKLEGREASLLEKLEQTDKELNLTRRLVSKLKKKQKLTEKEIEAKEERIGDVAGRLEGRKEVLRRRLVAIYKRGKLHPIEVLLSSHSFTDGFRRMKYLALIARQDRRVCGQILALKQELETEKKGLDVKLGELKKVRKEKESEEKNIEKERRGKKELLTEVRDKKEEQEKIAEELERAERKLQDLIEELERRRKEELARMGRREGLHYFQIHKGGIIWPTRGEVVAQFGKQVHPRYGTSTRNNGIDIRASRDSPVVAVGDGAVVYSDRFLGYGEIVLLDHKGGFYTLYAHLSESLVRVGDEVKEGDLIARVGESGSLEGPLLHFELRVDGKPVDPLPWLRRR